MKSNSDSRIVKLIKVIFNVRYWLDWDRVKVCTRYLYNGFKKFFVPEHTTDTETFEMAKKRLKLTDSEMELKKAGLFRLAITMVIVASLLLIYTIYLFAAGSLKGGFVGIVLVLMALTLAFRYHFWYFQMKEHKLGCTIREWFKQGLMGEK